MPRLKMFIVSFVLALIFLTIVYLIIIFEQNNADLVTGITLFSIAIPLILVACIFSAVRPFQRHVFSISGIKEKRKFITWDSINKIKLDYIRRLAIKGGVRDTSYLRLIISNDTSETKIIFGKKQVYKLVLIIENTCSNSIIREQLLSELSKNNIDNLKRLSEQ